MMLKKKFWGKVSMKMNKKGQEGMIGVVLGAIGLLFIASLFIIFPIWNVWSSEKSGQAQLAEAEWNRQITVQEAQAEKDSAILKKEADIIRAEGVAESNKIIATTLTSQYITWKWVEGMQTNQMQVVYVPTEANLPILEAKRLIMGEK